MTMGKVSEITITKGKTVKAADREEWIKLEFSVKAAVEDEAELNVAKAHLEGLIDGWLTSLQTPPPANPADPVVSAKQKLGPEIFPEDLRKLLAFEERDGFLVIKPKGFLGAEVFAKVAEVIKSYNGEYVSAGKSSHFRVPNKIDGGRRRWRMSFSRCSRPPGCLHRRP
jgi:hypothetical protein